MTGTLSAATYYGDGSQLVGCTGAYLPLAGGTMAGNINMGNNDITAAGLFQSNGSIVAATFVDTPQVNPPKTSVLNILNGNAGFDININAYADDVTISGDQLFANVNTLSARSAFYAGTVYTNAFVYNSNTADVTFDCADAYKYNFQGLGGAIFEGGVTGTGSSYFNGGLTADNVTVSGHVNASGGFVVENRTDDPASPITGQM